MLWKAIQFLQNKITVVLDIVKDLVVSRSPKTRKRKKVGFKCLVSFRDFSEIINLFKLCIYLGFSFTQDTKVVITLTVLFHSPSLTLSSYAKCNSESGEAL